MPSIFLAPGARGRREVVLSSSLAVGRTRFSGERRFFAARNRELVDNSSKEVRGINRDDGREEPKLAPEAGRDGVGESGGGPGGFKLDIIGRERAGRRGRMTGDGSGNGPGVNVLLCFKVKAGDEGGGVSD